MHQYFFLILCLFTLFSCTDDVKTSGYDYGTQSDSARYYFFKGWSEIMDYGRWTESEITFRKAVEHDPDWLLGKSLVGRITTDLSERKVILKELEAGKDQAGPDERSLLEVNLLSLQAANNRDSGIANSPESSAYRRQLAEKNFGQFARKYPEDSYFKAEYIEFLHANHSAQMALDSLRVLTTIEQRELGFYISYAAMLELELGNVDKAKIMNKVLISTLRDSSATTPLVLDAQIYMAQDSMEKAKVILDQVIRMDSNHLIAVGMRRQVEEALKHTKE